MSRGLRRSAVILFGLIVLFQFNNCGVYESGAPVANQESLSVECESETDCVAESNLNLKVQPLPIANFPVIPTQSSFNVGGDCNEAGYDNHRITWALKRNNVIVRTSGMIISGSSRHSLCVNGKFRLFVGLASITEDPVNRTGLLYGSGSNRAAYVLEIEIIAQDKQGNWIKNTTQGGMKQIHLEPVL